MTIVSMPVNEKRECLCVIFYNVEKDILEIEFPKIHDMEENLAILGKFIAFKKGLVRLPIK